MARNARLVIFLLCCCCYYYCCCCFDLTKEHECQRICDGNSTPKKCVYRFLVEISSGRNENSTISDVDRYLVINGKSPGPLISVCRNDTIEIEIRNRMRFGIETAFHWYGFADGNSPFMDGVPLITQCPIYSHTSFTYQLKAEKSGTYYYRAHSVAQQLDGLIGPLIVRDERDEILPSRILIILPEMKMSQVFNTGYEADLNVTALKFEIYDDSKGKSDGDENSVFRLRIVNASPLNCPVTLFSPTIPFKLIAIDGNDVKPIHLNKILINPEGGGKTKKLEDEENRNDFPYNQPEHVISCSHFEFCQFSAKFFQKEERMDLIVSEKVIKKGRAFGQKLCESHVKYGLDGGKSEKSDVKNENEFFGAEEEFIKGIESELSESLDERDLNIFVPYDETTVDNFKGIVDFRYKLGDSTPYAPSFLSKRSISFFQIRNKSFLYPPSPILSQFDDVPDDLICGLKKPSGKCVKFGKKNNFCECLAIINLPFNKNVDLFLIDEGKTGNESQIVHIHGYSFHVLHSKSYGRPIDSTEIEEEERLGKIKRNLLNPVKKDTVLVPNKGFVVLRLKSNNPGKWLIESTTSKSKTETGLEAILSVENPREELKVPENFPKCGTMKEPDLVIFSD